MACNSDLHLDVISSYEAQAARVRRGECIDTEENGRVQVFARPALFVNSSCRPAPQLVDPIAYASDSAGYPAAIIRRDAHHADLLAPFVHHEGQPYKVMTASREIAKES